MPAAKPKGALRSSAILAIMEGLEAASNELTGYAELVKGSTISLTTEEGLSLTAEWDGFEWMVSIP